MSKCLWFCEAHLTKQTRPIPTPLIWRYYAALLPRRGPHIVSHSVCPSVCLSVRPVSGCTLFTVAPSYERKSKIEKTSVFAYGPASRMYFSARVEGHISYGHLDRPHKFLFRHKITLYRFNQGGVGSYYYRGSNWSRAAGG